MTRHLLVIGGQRCGTTTLHGILDAHPDIAMARPVRPEPKVFCSDEATDRGIEWYHHTYFAHAHEGQLLGDKSTSYLEDPHAPERAARMLGRPLVLALLRDPVERAVSNWRFSTDNGLETRPLAAALRDDLAGRRPWDAGATSVSPFAYLERGRYAVDLRGWLERFPDTSHVIFLADLVSADDETDRLFTGLGLPPAAVEPPLRLNRSISPAEPLPPELVDELRHYFAPSDRELTELLGRTLPWATGGEG